jgi:hypothetical protein
MPYRDPAKRLPFGMLSQHYCAGAAAATCLVFMFLVTMIHNTSAQHLTVVPNVGMSLRPSNISTSTEILGEYHVEEGIRLLKSTCTPRLYILSLQLITSLGFDLHIL